MSAADIHAGIASSQFDPNSFFVESGTGNQISASDIAKQFQANPTGAPAAGAAGAPPAKSGDGAVSSTDITTGNASNTAVGAAAAAIQGGQMPAWAQSIMDSNNQMLATGKDALKLSFDASLAANNQQYASLFQDLNKQHSDASQAGTALAAQLNPYSDPRLSSATGGYLSSINDKYQAQADKLQSQMSAAQAQLQAGYYDNYTKLVNDAQKENNDFVTNIQNYQLSVFNSMKQDEQFQQSNALQEKTLALSTQNSATDDFRSYLTTLSGSPALQADVDSYLKTGNITAGLMPIVQKGQQAGLSPTEAISIFQYQSDSARKQQALDDYRNQQVVISQERATAATDRQTNAQLAIATTNAVLAAQSDMRAKGIEPGSSEWATGVASATGASSKALSSAQVGKYTQMGILGNQLSNISTDINAVNDKDPLWTTLQTMAGRNVSSFTDTQLASLNAKLTSLSGVIGKTFYGESGNLSNSDIQRVLNALPTGAGTPDLRKALYAGLLSVAKDNAIQTLQNDSQAGYQTATYIDSVQKIIDKADDAMASVKGSTASTPVISAEASDILKKYGIQQ